MATEAPFQCWLLLGPILWHGQQVCSFQHADASSVRTYFTKACLSYDVLVIYKGITQQLFQGSLRNKELLFKTIIPTVCLVFGTIAFYKITIFEQSTVQISSSLLFDSKFKSVLPLHSPSSTTKDFMEPERNDRESKTESVSGQIDIVDREMR